MTDEFSPEDHYSDKVGDVYTSSAISKDPMATDSIFQLSADYGVNTDSLVLDVGCANGGNTRKLIDKTGCRVVGIDFLQSLVEMGREENSLAGLDSRFSIQQGSILDIPFPEGHFDFVFCRDTLSVIDNLQVAAQECYRVLKPGGHMLVYVTQATSLLSRDENNMLRDNIGCASLDEKEMDAALAETFTVVDKTIMGSQGIQQRVENGDVEPLSNLMNIARLLTWKDDYITKHGQRSYEVALADLHWQVYMLLGKLRAIVYLLQKP